LVAVFVPAGGSAPEPPAPADWPEPFRSLPGRLRERRADWPEVPVPTGAGATEVRSVPLNLAPVRFESGHAFGAVRFRAPEKPGLDFVWAFSTPAAWRHWYILPADGDAGRRGFES
jgi:hypothetical protein